MAHTLQDSNNGTLFSTTGIGFNFPLGAPSPGEILLAAVAWNANARVVTSDAGAFTKIGADHTNDAGTGYDCAFSLWSRTADGSESGILSWSTTGAATLMSLVIARYSGLSITADASGENGDGVGSAYNVTGATGVTITATGATTQTDELAWLVWQQSADLGSRVFDGGFTEAWHTGRLTIATKDLTAVETPSSKFTCAGSAIDMTGAIQTWADSVAATVPPQIRTVVPRNAAVQRASRW